MAEPAWETVVYLAVRAFGWTPTQVAETDYGLLEALLMMHSAHESALGDEIRRAQRRRR